MKEDLLTIFNNYGKSHQISKLLEEVGELIEAIINDDKENITKETGDVFVVLNQFIHHYGIEEIDILKVMKYKVDRQIERMSKEDQ